MNNLTGSQVIQRLMVNIFDVREADVLVKDKSITINIWNRNDPNKAFDIENTTGGNIVKIYEHGSVKCYVVKFPMANIFDGGI